MKNKKITRLLRSLNINELKQFELFLDAEFIVGEKTPLRYLRSLQRGLLSEGEEDLEEQVVFGELFPGEEFDYRRMARLNTQMVSLFYRFMAIDHLERNPLDMWGAVLEHLDQRKQEELLDLSLSAVERVFHRAPESPRRLYHAYRLLEVQANRLPEKGRQTTSVPGAHVRQALDEFAELAQLRLECSALNRALVVGESDDDPVSLKEARKSTVTLLELYRLVKENLERPDDESRLRALYESFSQALSEFKGGLTHELREIGKYAINGSIRLVNLSGGGFASRQLLRGIYQKQIEAGILFENEGLSSFHFKNIVQNLAQIGEFKEAIDFIESFKGRLLSDYNNNAENFSRGYLAYYQGDFEEAKAFFHEILSDHKDIFYNLDSRLMYLRTLFELGDLTFLESFSEAFRQLLRRKTIPEVFRKMYGDANRNIARLARIVYGNPDKKGSKLRRFREDILADESALLKQWLLEKAAD